jgi:hypothetical protein
MQAFSFLNFPLQNFTSVLGKKASLREKVAVLKTAMSFGPYLFGGELDQTKNFIVTCVLTVPLDSITLRNTAARKLTPNRCLFTYQLPMGFGLEKVSLEKLYFDQN